MELTKEQIESLAMFALDVLDDFAEIASLDGGDLQDMGEKHKILIPQIVHAPCCDEGCVCAQICSDEEFQDGVTCYRIADWLTRVAEQRDGAVQPIREACPDDRHMYYIHFLNYVYCPYCGKPLHS